MPTPEELADRVSRPHLPPTAKAAVERRWRTHDEGLRDCVAVELCDMPVAWRLGAHAHDHHELVLVAAGAIATAQDGEQVTTPSGWVKWHPAGVVHAEEAIGTTAPRLLLFAWRGRDPGPEAPRHRPDPHGRIRMLLEWLVALRRRPAPERDATIPVASAALLAAFAEPQPPDAKDDIVVRSATWLSDRVARPIYLAEMARACGLSAFHYARRFRAAAGCSPMTFVRRMRIERARELLLSTDLPLHAIAPRCGFADEFQLCKAYRAATGMTPGSLRKRTPAK